MYSVYIYIYILCMYVYKKKLIYTHTPRQSCKKNIQQDKTNASYNTVYHLGIMFSKGH